MHTSVRSYYCCSSILTRLIRTFQSTSKALSRTNCLNRAIDRPSQHSRSRRFTGFIGKSPDQVGASRSGTMTRTVCSLSVVIWTGDRYIDRRVGSGFKCRNIGTVFGMKAFGTLCATLKRRHHQLALYTRQWTSNGSAISYFVILVFTLQGDSLNAKNASGSKQLRPAQGRK